MFDRFIRFSAALSPHARAVSNGASHVTYRRFNDDIDRCAAALAESGLVSGMLAGVCVADPYLHLLLTLACARLRVATVSIIPAMAGVVIAIARPTTVLSDGSGGDLAPTGLSVLSVDTTWVNAALARVRIGPFPSPETDPEALARVQLSSGTTGTPKAVGLSWRMMADRVQFNLGDGVERMVSLIGPESGAIQAFLLVWMRRGCVFFPSMDAAELAANLPALNLTGLLGTPSQISALLAALPRDAAASPHLWVNIAGGHAGPGLMQAVRERLGTQVNLAYASTEAGLCSLAFASQLRETGGVGWAAPWTEIEAVDEAGSPVAAGQTGRLRVRGPGVVSGYLYDHALTAERFVDGWFYPGDLGRISTDGLITVLGREDEVMNIGGEKYLPDVLEGPILALPGVTDAAAFALDDAQGVTQPWLAIVRGEGFDERLVSPALPAGMPPVRIAWTDAIPKTPLGKVQRELLKTAARALPPVS